VLHGRWGTKGCGHNSPNPVCYLTDTDIVRASERQHSVQRGWQGMRLGVRHRSERTNRLLKLDIGHQRWRAQAAGGATDLPLTTVKCIHPATIRTDRTPRLLASKGVSPVILCLLPLNMLLAPIHEALEALLRGHGHDFSSVAVRDESRGVDLCDSVF
jgi:hypothetical protein